MHAPRLDPGLGIARSYLAVLCGLDMSPDGYQHREPSMLAPRRAVD
jgi:hypothetical protein